MRSLAAPFAFGIALVLSAVCACNGDDSSSPSGQDGAAPPVCAGPCKPGAMCYAQMTNACNGTYYCWSDSQWHCAPPDSGGPGGMPPDSGEDDGAVESAAPTDAPAEAVADASGG